ncbi:MAG: HPF/RaiA family ribosome-associated protein [Nitrospirae bacterium]|nr:HPF/RaiA family ribosome-associated protein [Nitrospirota bacterium]MCL5977144.1 HPF/RaiA family ribosome-associated protein [Nitrospirota bacterium]
MKLDLQITAHNIELSDFAREDIREKAEKLDKFYDRIMRCRVVVDVPHRHKHEGILYDVHIYMTVPGYELIVKREPGEDLTVAIRDAFDAARRKLEDFVRRQRGDVKHHEEIPPARITALFPDKGYGFLTTPDGREIYFHENSILNKDFNKLRIGTEVRFAEEQGEKGPQASTVTVLD